MLKEMAVQFLKKKDVAKWLRVGLSAQLVMMTITSTAAAQDILDRKSTWTFFDRDKEYVCVLSSKHEKQPRTLIRRGERGTLVYTDLQGNTASEKLTCRNHTCASAETFPGNPDSYVSSFYLLYPEKRVAMTGQVVLFEFNNAPSEIIPSAAEYELDCSTRDG